MEKNNISKYNVLDRLNKLNVSKILIAVLAICGTALATWFVGMFIEKLIQKLLKKHLIK